MQLNDPSYAYLECYIPKSIITSTENFIECTLDIEKFPLIVNRKITLPETFPDVNCKIEYWNTINKEINTGVCYPSIFGEIKPDSPKQVGCVKGDLMGLK